MNIKNRPFDPTLLVKTTLPEEAGDTINYEYRHCDIEEGRLSAACGHHHAARIYGGITLGA